MTRANSLKSMKRGKWRNAALPPDPNTIKQALLNEVVWRQRNGKLSLDSKEQNAG
jgi:hypothetical protein